jgi:hypothetical protein
MRGAAQLALLAVLGTIGLAHATGPCADPVTFQADASYTYYYRCLSVLSAEFDQSACSALGCSVSDEGGQEHCVCMHVTDAEACLATLPGELSRACACAWCEVNACMT